MQINFMLAEGYCDQINYPLTGMINIDAVNILLFTGIVPSSADVKHIVSTSPHREPCSPLNELCPFIWSKVQNPTH